MKNIIRLSVYTQTTTSYRKGAVVCMEMCSALVWNSPLGRVIEYNKAGHRYNVRATGCVPSSLHIVVDCSALVIALRHRSSTISPPSSLYQSDPTRDHFY